MPEKKADKESKKTKKRKVTYKDTEVKVASAPGKKNKRAKRVLKPS